MMQSKLNGKHISFMKIDDGKVIEIDHLFPADNIFDTYLTVNAKL